ncbi:hypothetical protein AgCh_009978 [Apium graveolens]
MWNSLILGWQAVPDLWFTYGFRLTMHPFFESTGIRVYFDTKSSCTKLMENPTSNSSWHAKSIWYEGAELRRIGPFHHLYPDVVKYLGVTASPGSVDLSGFCGVSSRYKVG